jgi:hypothetical protein
MSAFEDVDKLVKEWQPQVLPTKLQYRNSLTTLLRKRCRDSHAHAIQRGRG